MIRSPNKIFRQFLILIVVTIAITTVCYWVDISSLLSWYLIHMKKLRTVIGNIYFCPIGDHIHNFTHNTSWDINTLYQNVDHRESASCQDPLFPFLPPEIHLKSSKNLHFLPLLGSQSGESNPSPVFNRHSVSSVNVRLWGLSCGKQKFSDFLAK